MGLSQVRYEDDLLRFLDSFEEDLKQLKEKISLLQFKRLVDKVKVPEIVDLETEFTRKVSDPGFVELIHSWEDRVQDPILKRRLSLWKKMLVKSAVMRNPEVRNLTRELGDIMITHKYKVGGKISDLSTIKDILRTSPDSELRRKAWQGKVELSKTIAPGLLRLIQLRNDLAKEIGFQNYLEFTFQLEGLSLDQVRNILHELTNKSDPIYHKILADGQEKLGLSQIEPWDLMYLLESIGQIDPDLFPKNRIESELRRWGKNHGADLDFLGISLVFTDIPYNGLCFHTTDRDIRILANPANGHTYFRTLFHELGHALHKAFNQQQSFILQHDSGILSEAMAELIGYIPRQPGWLLEMGFDTQTSASIHKKLIAPWFHYLRERTTNALAEYRIYENPSQDPDRILSQLEHEILGVSLEDTPRWAADSWLINYPVYWQNYVLADIITSQIHSTLNKRFDGLHGHPEALVEVRKIYYEPGALIDWQEKLLTHTGVGLNTTALVNDLKQYLE